jgi:hypothetical protein
LGWLAGAEGGGEAEGRGEGERDYWGVLLQSRWQEMQVKEAEEVEGLGKGKRTRTKVGCYTLIQSE